MLSRNTHGEATPAAAKHACCDACCTLHYCTPEGCEPMLGVKVQSSGPGILISAENLSCSGAALETHSSMQEAGRWFRRVVAQEH
jgi:hypothetical protein